MIKKLTVAERMFVFDNDGNLLYERTKPLPEIEYSEFGSPQQKIGNFTQTKLGGFNA